MKNARLDNVFWRWSKAHQALLVRLYSRKGPFSGDKLNYAEIQSLDSVLEDLGQAGWVRRNPLTWHLEILAGKLTRKEIQAWFGVPASHQRTGCCRRCRITASTLVARLPFDFIETSPQTVQIYLDLFFRKPLSGPQHICGQPTRSRQVSRIPARPGFPILSEP